MKENNHYVDTLHHAHLSPFDPPSFRQLWWKIKKYLGFLTRKEKHITLKANPIIYEAERFSLSKHHSWNTIATVTLHNGKVFARTTKKSRVSIFYSYRDLAWTKHKFKMWFFGQIFLANLNFDLLLHNFSMYVIFDFFLQFFCTKDSWRYGSDKKALHTDGQTDGRTDGQTDGHTPREEQYMSPAWGDIQS